VRANEKEEKGMREKWRRGENTRRKKKIEGKKK